MRPNRNISFTAGRERSNRIFAALMVSVHMTDSYGENEIMEIDKDKVITQEQEPEPAPIDQVEERVEAEMKEIEGRAKERVAQGLQDKELEQEARELKEEGKQELDEARKRQD
jgi:hypothetical protein